MHFDPKSEGEFIEKYLGPILNDTHPEVKIYIYDQNKGGMIKWVNDIIVNNPNAAQYISGTAVHWYDGDHFDALNESHYLAPTFEILATESTESYDKNEVSNPSWTKGEHYAHDIIGDFNNYVTGFIDWNLILDLEGGPDHACPNDAESHIPYVYCGSDSMLIIDDINNIIYPQIFYYYVGHLSRFISYGDIRIGFNVNNISAHGSGIEMTSFYSNKFNKTTVIIMNPTNQSWTYKIKDSRDIYQNMAINSSVKPHSIYTIIY